MTQTGRRRAILAVLFATKVGGSFTRLAHAVRVNRGLDEMNPLTSAVRRFAHLVWSRRVRSDLHHQSSCRLLDIDLVVAPGVLHPKHFVSSRWLATHVAGLALRGQRVADLGTGSGLVAMVAARAGARVTAVDIHPDAVRCARENVARNALDSTVDVICSDVFANLPPDARFDLILTNPPFFPREPRDLKDHAFAAGAHWEFFRKLAAALPERLAPDGSLLLVHSSDADFAAPLEILGKSGLHGVVIATRRSVFETLTLQRFSREGG